MAELADAYGSGPYERKLLQVQLLLPAPQLEVLTVFKCTVRTFSFMLWLFSTLLNCGDVL